MTDIIWRKKDSFWLPVSEDSDGHLTVRVWAGHGSAWPRRDVPSLYRDRKQRAKQEGAGYHIPQGPYSNDLSFQDPITSQNRAISERKEGTVGSRSISYMETPILHRFFTVWYLQDLAMATFSNGTLTLFSMVLPCQLV